MNTLSTVKVESFPHSVDIYAPAGATHAVVFLHGGSGRNYSFANNLGINTSGAPPTAADVNWTWLAANKIIAVFPQGQTIASAPNSYTWDNHAMVSGQDDVAFLKALSAYIRTNYGFGNVALAGHSMGGTMVNRMWCESPATFSAYFAMAGPASGYYDGQSTPCKPSNDAPYFGIIGSADTIMQTTGQWEATTWTINPIVSNTGAFVDPVVIGEWVQHQSRAAMTCDEVPATTSKVVSGNFQTWTNCGGRVVENLISGADHGVASIESKSGAKMIDLIAGFVAGR